METMLVAKSVIKILLSQLNTNLYYSTCVGLFLEPVKLILCFV